MAIPAYSNRICVRLDFVVEFKKDPAGAVYVMSQNISEMAIAAIEASITPKMLKERFGAARLRAGARLRADQLTKKQAETRQRGVDNWRKDHGLGPEPETKWDEESGEVPEEGSDNGSGRRRKPRSGSAKAKGARGKIPGVRKAKPRKW